MKIDLSLESDRRQHALQRVRDRGIIVPTFAQMRNPESIPVQIKENSQQLACGT